KIIASAFAKKNRDEIKQRTQIKLDFEEDYTALFDSITAAFDLWKRLPEKTPDDIKDKQRLYEKLSSGAQHWKLKTLADMQVAQFFIPKTDATKNLLLSDAEYQKHLRGKSAIQTQKSAKATAVAIEKKFFHWFIEFPEVFKDAEGFDCILGNPPFLAGSKISQNFGTPYLNYLKTYYINSGGQSDFVTYFFKRDASIIGPKGLFCLISTNTISQGESRISCLEYLIEKGFRIHFAIKSIKWPGLAAVDISMIGISREISNIEYSLNLRKVNHISSFLDENQHLSEPYVLFSNVNKSFKGVSVYGDGFILNETKYNELLSENEVNAQAISLYLDGDDLNSYPKQLPTRFVINFHNWKEEACRVNFPTLYEIIRTKVKPEREMLKSDKTARENWW